MPEGVEPVMEDSGSFGDASAIVPDIQVALAY